MARPPSGWLDQPTIKPLRASPTSPQGPFPPQTATCAITTSACGSHGPGLARGKTLANYLVRHHHAGPREDCHHQSGPREGSCEPLSAPSPRANVVRMNQAIRWVACNSGYSVGYMQFRLFGGLHVMLETATSAGTVTCGAFRTGPGQSFPWLAGFMLRSLASCTAHRMVGDTIHGNCQSIRYRRCISWAVIT